MVKRTKVPKEISKELGVLFDMTIEADDEEISVMDHGDSISIGHEGPFDIENVMNLSKMLDEWLQRFRVSMEFRPPRVKK